MKKAIQWVDGKKTYIVSAAIVVYSILAVAHKVPNPDQVGVWAIAVAAYAVALRSVLTKFLAAMKASK